MNQDLIFNLLNNTALLLALSIIYAIIPIKIKNHCIKNILLGCLISLVGIGIMSNPLQLMEGIQFDTRTILISMTGFFFGLIPTAITVLFTAIFRIYLGGSGIFMGISTILMSACLGLLWHYFRFKRLETKKYRTLHLYLFGFITHIGMILCMLLLPWESFLDIIGKMMFPVLIIYPVGTVLLGLLLYIQKDRIEAQNELKASEERLRITLLSVGDGVIATDQNGTITMLSRTAEKITGWTNEEAVGRPIQDVLRIINEFTREKVQDPVQKVMEQGTIVGLANHTLLICRDGTEKPIADSAAPIKNELGEITGIVLVLRDSTEERKKQAEISYIGHHDTLTGLYNRYHFEKAMVSYDRKDNLPISIIIGDVNALKLTNDAFGHHMGDELLKKTAKIITEECREGDLVARWAGDEFIILLLKADSSEAKRICDNIRNRCAAAKINNMKISISLGYDTKHKIEEDIETVLKQAEDFMYRKKSAESLSMRGHTLNMILSTLHEKSPREQLHSYRVSALCKKIGAVMHFSDKEINELGIIGLMHDIGKIIIDEKVLNKAGRLTATEWKEMKRHPEVGFRILSASTSMSYIAEYILCHHEHYDGKGYPNGTSGEEIPIQSRILTVADAYDAMTTERSYKKAVPQELALQVIRDNAGSHFDPDVVFAICRLFEAEV